MTYKINDASLTLTIDSRLYNETVIHKCFYWYSQDYMIDISLGKDAHFEIVIQPNKENSTSDWNSLIEKIKQHLVDFKLRDIVNTETKTIRELLVAKAFAWYDVEDIPVTNVSDPVGFSPLTI